MKCRVYILLVFISFACAPVFGQAPSISYPTPKSYVINTAISPASPANTGGAVPPNIYGNVITFAGQNGTQGLSGGGMGVSQFRVPTQITTDVAGNIYVNDPNNRAIRKIAPDGNVTTPSQGVPDSGVPSTERDNNFKTPTGLVIDASGNIYIADSGNNLIRKETAPLYPISNFAGDRSAGSNDGTGTAASFNNPTQMATDAGGNIFIVDNTNLIRKVTPQGVVTTFARLQSPNPIGGIVVDNTGNLFITIPAENIIEKISPAGTVIKYAGTGTAGETNGAALSATFTTPSAIAIDGSQNLYLLSNTENVVRKISSQGVVSTFAGNIAPGSADGDKSAATFNMPQGIAVDSFGNIYITDSGNFTVRKIFATGYVIDKQLPAGLTFDKTNGVISGTPTELSPATDYTVTGYNAYGSSSTIVNIRVLASSNLTFGPIAPKTTCDADFDPATSASNITYTSSNPSVATIVNGKIHLAGAGTSVITANDGISSISQTLTVTYVAPPTISISANPNPVCEGSLITFTASATNAGTTPVYKWLINGVASATGVPFTGIFTNGQVITCSLTAGTVCTTPVTSNAITVQTSPLPTIAFEKNIIGLKQGTSVQLAPAIAGDISTYAWSPAIGLDNPSVANPVANPTATTKYNLMVITTFGCQTMASITVTVFNTIDVKNTFTPNSDGINDTWLIPSLAYFPGCTVRVYNRLGNLVYYSVNYAQPWDGNYKNSPLPTGTYYYIIDPKNSAPVISGDVTIIR